MKNLRRILEALGRQVNLIDKLVMALLVLLFARPIQALLAIGLSASPTGFFAYVTHRLPDAVELFVCLSIGLIWAIFFTLRCR